MRNDIDLSTLTASEIEQVQSCPEVLTQGSTDVCLYMRYSSAKQTEQSIEGQLRDCLAYCKSQDYRLRGIYVDRAASASVDATSRPSFQQMIAEAPRGRWRRVIVWKLDRFARNRTDSAMYKYKLKKQGVTVESATERISGQPEGIILESVLEGMAEFYSAELSQKVTRGMRESALKGQFLGGTVTLGYKVEDHHLAEDEKTAHIVREAFTRFAAGESMADIVRAFRDSGYRTSRGGQFTVSAISRMLQNERYIGVNRFQGERIEGAFPALVSKDLFEKVHSLVGKRTASRPRKRGQCEYILSGKLYCGHCLSKMVGECGRTVAGEVRRYYACAKRKRGESCDKKAVPKEAIEDAIIQDALELLTDNVIEHIADLVMAYLEKEDDTPKRIESLRQLEAELTKGIGNITSAIEKGIMSDALIERLGSLEEQRKEVRQQIEEASAAQIPITRDHIIFWLSHFRGRQTDDPEFRKEMIRLFIRRVYLYDDPEGYRATVEFNFTDPREDPTPGVPAEGDSVRIISHKVYQAILIRTEGNTVIGIVTKKHPLP